MYYVRSIRLILDCVVIFSMRTEITLCKILLVLGTASELLYLCNETFFVPGTGTASVLLYCVRFHCSILSFITFIYWCSISLRFAFYFSAQSPLEIPKEKFLWDLQYMPHQNFIFSNIVISECGLSHSGNLSYMLCLHFFLWMNPGINVCISPFQVKFDILFL